MFINIFAFLTSGGYFVIDMKVTYIFIKYPKNCIQRNIFENWMDLYFHKLSELKEIKWPQIFYFPSINVYIVSLKIFQ